MPVELRKRAAPAAALPPAKKKTPAQSKTKKDAHKADEHKAEPVEDGPVDSKPVKHLADKSAAKPAVRVAPKVGDNISIENLGGEVETHEGTKTTLAKLVSESKSGVAIFTYPKASTPGCTTQACLFRDSYEPLTATGLSIYGLSADTPKANTTFRTNKNLPYPLLCDPDFALIGAIGMKKAPKGVTRGIFVVNKEGKVLAAEPGGPAPTVEVVKKIVAKMGGDSSARGVAAAEETAKKDVA